MSKSDKIDKKYLKVSELAEMLNLHPSTIRCWIRSGYVNAMRTRGGHYRISNEEVKRILEAREEGRRAVIYVRSRFLGLRDELERRVEILRRYCHRKNYRVVKVIKEMSSFEGEERKGLMKLLDMIVNGGVDVVVLFDTEEISRFCFNYLNKLIKGYGVKVETVLGKKSQWEKEELVEDLVYIIKKFAGRICPGHSTRDLENYVRDFFSRGL